MSRSLRDYGANSAARVVLVIPLLAGIVVSGCRGRGGAEVRLPSDGAPIRAETESVPEAPDSNPAPSMMAQCERNLRALVMAAQAYEQQTGGVLDPARWPEQLRPFLKATGSGDEALHCPDDGSTTESSYALAPRPTPGSHDAVLFFESAGKRSGGPSDMAFRHADCGLVATRSGRVLHVTREDADRAAKTHSLTADMADDGDVLPEKATARW